MPSATSSRTTYQSTGKARDLRPVLLSLAAWGNRHLEQTWVPPEDYLAPPA